MCFIEVEDDVDIGHTKNSCQRVCNSRTPNVPPFSDPTSSGGGMASVERRLDLIEQLEMDIYIKMKVYK